MKTILFILLLPILAFTQGPDLINTVVDTASLATIRGGDGQVMYLRQYSSTDTSGGGWFIVRTSSETVGTNYFTHPDPAKQWVRRDTDALEQGFVADTTALKALTLGEGKTAYLKQLSSTNTNGGGWFVAADSAFVEGVVAFGHPTAAKQWVRDVYLETRIVNVVWAGAFPDSTNADLTADGIQAASDAAYNLGTNVVYIPAGQFLADTTIYLMPPIEFYGEGNTSRIYSRATGDTVNTMLYASHSASPADSTLNVYHIHDLYLEGDTFMGYDPSEYSSNPMGSAIFLTHGGTGNEIYRATIENVHMEKFDAGGAYIWRAQYATIRNCVARNMNFTALNIAFSKYAVHNGNQVDLAILGSENFTRPRDFDGADTTFNDYFEFKDNKYTNIYRYGLKLYGGTNINIEGNIISAIDTFTTVIGEFRGIWISPTLDTLAASGNKGSHIKNLTIKDNLIENFAAEGIAIVQHDAVPSANDTSVLSITIEGNIIKNNQWRGIYILPDSSRVRRYKEITIKNNKLFDNNASETGGYSSVSIVLYYADSTLIENNRIYSADQAGVGRFPIGLFSSDNVIIKNNDFRDPYSRVQSVAVDTFSTGYVLSNNLGLDIDQAVYSHQETAGYYQNINTDALGTMISSGSGVTGYLLTVEDDSLFVTDYNTSGVAGTKSLIAFSYGVRAGWYSAGGDTINLSSSTNVWVAGSDSGAFTSLSRSGITAAKDSLVFPSAGLYDCHGSISFRPLTQDTSRIRIFLGVNGEGNSAGGGFVTVSDSLSNYQISFDRIYQFSANDYVKMWAHNFTNSEDIEIIESMVIFRKIE